MDVPCIGSRPNTAPRRYESNLRSDTLTTSRMRALIGDHFVASRRHQLHKASDVHSESGLLFAYWTTAV